MAAPSLVRGLLVAMLLPSVASASAGELRVAVASNFAEPCRTIVARFEAATGHEVTVIVGSTGKLYAQIVNGARWDAFLAADGRRPELLERRGLGVPGSRFTYARGRLVLWSPERGLVDPEGRVLSEGGFRFLAIANARLAPYGRAAEQVLASLGLSEAMAGRLVRGENIVQTYQFVASGNAELGFVAWSQVMRPGHRTAGSSWLVPEELHEEIAQQALLLRDAPASRAFLGFLRGGEARAVIESHGYAVP